jgi:SagB-type dehydrogenase family enzyme
LINKNDDLPRDIYYYHPQHHGLYQLQVQDDYLEEITQNAMVALGNVNEVPPVIVVLTSRFKKMGSKYERIAYRNTILSVGAAFQTMYLTGTAMNLSTCALGSGNPDLFAKAIDVDPLEECAVGEFVVGPLV